MNVNLEILKLNHAFKWSDLIDKQLKIQEIVSGEGVQVIFGLSECGRVYIMEMNNPEPNEFVKDLAEMGNGIGGVRGKEQIERLCEESKERFWKTITGPKP